MGSVLRSHRQFKALQPVFLWSPLWVTERTVGFRCASLPSAPLLSPSLLHSCPHPTDSWQSCRHPWAFTCTSAICLSFEQVKWLSYPDECFLFGDWLCWQPEAVSGQSSSFLFLRGQTDCQLITNNTFGSNFSVFGYQRCEVFIMFLSATFNYSQFESVIRCGI